MNRWAIVEGPSGTNTPEKILQLDNGNQNIPKIAGKGLSDEAR